jgi:two-component system, OmpR family, sensor histidine kinase BaeS
MGSLRGRLAVSHIAVAMAAVAAVVLAVSLLANRAADAYVSELDARIARIQQQEGFVPPGLARQQQERSAQTAAADDFRGQIGTAAIVGTGVAVVVAIGLALYVGGLVTRPVRRSARAATRVAAGNRELDLPKTGIAELDELRVALQQLGADLEAAERQRDRVVDDVTHELRTPLAVLRGHVEGIRDGVIEPDPTTIQRLLDELRRLERLVDDLRASTELTTQDLVRERIDLASLIEEAAQRHGPAAAGVGVALDAEADSGPVLGDRHRLAQVLDNLVDNALTHAPRGSRIRLIVRAGEGTARAEVVDEGPGLAPADQALVFDRLYRADRARDRSLGGAGIGLAVARRIIEAHEGQIGVESTPGRGSTFWFTLPLTKA